MLFHYRVDLSRSPVDLRSFAGLVGNTFAQGGKQKLDDSIGVQFDIFSIQFYSINIGETACAKVFPANPANDLRSTQWSCLLTAGNSGCCGGSSCQDTLQQRTVYGAADAVLPSVAAELPTAAPAGLSAAAELLSAAIEAAAEVPPAAPHSAP